MDKHLTKNEQYVLKVIRANEGVQNDEAKLLEAVWLSQGWSQSNSLYYNLSHVMHSETVARARRRLHELGLIEYSANALRRRTKRYKAETQRLSNNDITASIVKPKVMIKEVNGELVTVLS